MSKLVLQVEAEVSENKFIFRMGGASADLEDGRRLSIDSSLGGDGIIVTVTSTDRNSWRSYVLNAQALGQAVLVAEESMQTLRCKKFKPNGERIDGCGWQGTNAIHYALPGVDGKKMCCPECRSEELVPVPLDRATMEPAERMSHADSGASR